MPSPINSHLVEITNLIVLLVNVNHYKGKYEMAADAFKCMKHLNEINIIGILITSVR